MGIPQFCFVGCNSATNNTVNFICPEPSMAS